jgi:hypothetical protein
MPEALTESFCERCGTRYEFAAPARLNPIRKTRGLISGLKNYIMSQDALGDAVGDAMRSEEDSLAAQQLDAFHKSFNFCIDCRQYACTNCWNESAGRCRSCVPIAGTDDLIERFEATFHAHRAADQAGAAEEAAMAEAELNRRLGIETWPTADLSHAPTNGHLDVGWPADELAGGAPALPAAEGDATVPAEPEPEPMVAEVEPEPEPVVAFEPQPMVAFEPERAMAQADAYPPLQVLTWEEDAEFELEPEPVVAEVLPEPEPEPEPMVAEVEPQPELVVVAEVLLEPEPMVAVEAEPAVAEVEPEHEPVAAEVEPEPESEPVAAAEPAPEPEPILPIEPRPILPISETILRIPRPAPAPAPTQEERVAAAADDASLAARRAQLDLLGLGDPGEGPVAPERPAVLPYRSRGAAASASELAARRGAQADEPGAMVGSFWEASAREVAGALSQIGVQSCGECGLSLSASARFCRRCGTRQARSA